MKKKLTASIVEETAPVPRKCTIYDTAAPYLALVVIPTGTRTFYYCRRIRGKLQYIRIGKATEVPLAQARAAALEISRRIAAGLAPVDVPEPETVTLGQIWRDYITMRRARGDRERSTTISARRFEMYVPGALADREAGKVTRKEVQDLTFEIGERSGKRCATLLMIDLRAAYNYARKTGTVACDNPAAGLTLFPNVERERFLRDDEARRFFAALQQAENENFRDFVMLAILTGKRKNEILRLKWEHVDLAQSMLIIPRENAKNGRADFAVLDAAAAEILQRRRNAAIERGERSPWVFAADTPCCHYSSPEKAFRALLARAGIADFRIHDMRRTLASYMAANNASLHTIATTLGQTSTAATHIYARLPTAARRAAVSAAVETLTQIAGAPRSARAELDRLLDADPELAERLLETARKISDPRTA